jgi:DNA invertase Pin-like site-specific DNA recombinase
MWHGADPRRASETISASWSQYSITGTLAKFERDIIRGRMGGQPKKMETPTKVAMAKNLYANHFHSIADICKRLGISRATLYRYLDVPANATDSK